MIEPPVFNSRTSCANPSQRDGLFEYPVTEQIIESLLRHDLYSTAKKLLQIRDQPTWKPGAWLRTNLDQEVDITLRPCIAPVP